MQSSSVTPRSEFQLWRILSELDFFHLIFDAIPLQIAVKSTRPDSFGRFLLWNRVAEEWMGLPAKEVIGRTDYDFFPQEQADFFLEKDREVVASRQVVDIACEPILSRVHGRRFLHTIKTPIFDKDGEPLALLAVSEDITERVQAEARLVEAKETAERANRAKSDFLAMMSHEIRTPLNGVLGFADLLVETQLDARQGEFVQIIRQSGANLLHVLNDILDYAKIESGKLAIDAQPVALRELVEAAVETFRAKAGEKQIALACEIDPALPDLVLVDAVRLRQVLVNLVSNAVKFTMHGCVTLRAELAGGVAAGRAPVRLTVRDTGIGIPPEAVERLFEPFEQLDVSMARRFGGTGLGLAIVQKLVRMMDGGIRVASAVGEGTTFTIDLRLPVVTPAPVSAEGRVEEESPSPPHPLAILIVEDNSVNRRLVRLMLERLGCDPDEAPDGLCALECVERRVYDLVLMDIQMPGMDGYETARKIRVVQPRARIVALTAHALPADHTRSAAEGMHAHLAKPVRLDALRELLEKCAAFQTAPAA